MSTCLCSTLLAIALTTGFTAISQASTSANIPSVSQDPVVQHLKLSEEQTAKIQTLRQGFENNISQIKVSNYQDGALASIIHSGKWDDAKVKQQLAAFDQLNQQVRYYRMKYYFNIGQVLTPEQHEQVEKDLSAAINQPCVNHPLQVMLAREMPPCSGGYRLILPTMVFFLPGRILRRKRTRIGIGKRYAFKV